MAGGKRDVPGIRQSQVHPIKASNVFTRTRWVVTPPPAARPPRSPRFKMLVPDIMAFVFGAPD